MTKSLGYVFRVLQGGRGHLLQEQWAGPSAGPVVRWLPPEGAPVPPNPSPCSQGAADPPCSPAPVGSAWGYTALDESRFKGDSGVNASTRGSGRAGRAASGRRWPGTCDPARWAGSHQGQGWEGSGRGRPVWTPWFPPSPPQGWSVLDHRRPKGGCPSGSSGNVLSPEGPLTTSKMAPVHLLSQAGPSLRSCVLVAHEDVAVGAQEAGQGRPVSQVSAGRPHPPRGSVNVAEAGELSSIPHPQVDKGSTAGIL